MRIRLPVGRGLFFGGVFLLALLALLPLRLAADWLRLPASGIAARDAVGSVWAGVLHGTQLRNVQLGDLVAELKAWPFLLGRARVELGRNDGVLGRTDARADRLDGALTVTSDSYALDDMTMRLPLDAQTAPLPITAIDLSDVSVRYANGLCVSADGAVTVTTSGNLAGLSIPTTMTGNARCEGGALLLPLAGASGLERLDLRFTGGSRYRATLSMRPSDPSLQQRLAASGFTAAGGVYSLSVDGRLS